MLFHCIYTSVQTRPLPPAEVSALVTHSRQKNLRNHLTGILLHVGETFFQVLEGEQDTIEQLYAQILQDPRHTRITRIIFEPIARRYFQDSDMTLAAISPLELSNLLEAADPDRVEQVLADLDEGRAKRLIRAFSDGRWRSSNMSSSSRMRAVPA